MFVWTKRLYSEVAVNCKPVAGAKSRGVKNRTTIMIGGSFLIWGLLLGCMATQLAIVRYVSFG